MEPMMIPYVVHEGHMAREERKQRKFWVLIVLETIGVVLCLKLLSTTYRNKQ